MNQKFFILIILLLILIIGAISFIIFYEQKGKDLRTKCCAECIKEFQPQIATSPYCINKEKMSQECVDYLGIRDLQGINTAKAYSDKCR